MTDQKWMNISGNLRGNFPHSFYVNVRKELKYLKLTWNIEKHMKHQAFAIWYNNISFKYQMNNIYFLNGHKFFMVILSHAVKSSENIRVDGILNGWWVSGWNFFLFYLLI